MKPLEEVVITGTSDSVAIFNELVAYNTWVLLMGNEKVDKFDYDHLVMIAGYLRENERSAILFEPKKFGENTIVYSADGDYTKIGVPTLVDRITPNEERVNGRKHEKIVIISPEVELTHVFPKGELYMVIENGTELNGKTYNKRIIETFPEMELTDKVPEGFVNLMKNVYGYTETQAIQIYNHLMGTNYPVPSERTKSGLWWKIPLAVGLSASLAIGGVHKVNKAINDPAYRAVVEEAAQTPDTNVYNARHNARHLK